jgi:D-alanyl-D-alanine carboxypeptidase/D-alanyl-D-alanine-endopeptidase (penicillin-binding protein 4)
MNLFYRLCCFCRLAGLFGLFWLPHVAIAAPATREATREAAPQLPPAVAQALARAGVPREAVSFEVRAVSGDAAPRLSYRAGIAMNPASVMKLVTTFSALDILGPNFTWKTGFYTDGTLSKGVLTGNLIIKGGGDPKWVLERMEENFKTLQVLGVQRITGDIILDNSVFELPEKNSADFDGEPMRPYNSAPDGLLVNFKALILKFVPDPQTQTIRVISEPPMADVAIDAQVTATTDGCGDWRSGLRADFSNPNKVQFGGSYSVRCGESTWPVAYVEPASYAVRVVKAMHKASGGLLDGKVRYGTLPRTALLLWQAPSLPLSLIIADVNKFSNNVMAQQVFLTLSAQYSTFNSSLHLPGAPRTGNFARSATTVQNWWRERFGRAVKAPTLDNGSGLSRSERITAQSLSELLKLAARHQSAEVFTNSLSIAGVDGTAANMSKRGIAVNAIGNAQLKTGTLHDVAAVAGYATGKSGKRYSVVGLINHSNASAARPALDALVEWAVLDD